MPLDRPERRRRAIDAAICFGILAASFAYAPYAHDGPVLCPLRLASGIPCPGCGLTRSCCALASGRPAEAFRHHLLGPLAFGCAAGLGIAWAFEAAAGRRIEWLHRLTWSASVGWSLAGVVIAYYLARLATWGASGELVGWMRDSPCGRGLAWLLGVFGS